MYTVIAYRDTDPATEYRVGIYFSRDDAATDAVIFAMRATQADTPGWSFIPVRLWDPQRFTDAILTAKEG